MDTQTQLKVDTIEAKVFAGEFRDRSTLEDINTLLDAIEELEDELDAAAQMIEDEGIA